MWKIASSNPPVSSCGFISISMRSTSVALLWSGPVLSFFPPPFMTTNRKKKIEFWGHTWQRTPLERLIIAQHSSSYTACGLGKALLKTLIGPNEGVRQYIKLRRRRLLQRCEFFIFYISIKPTLMLRYTSVWLYTEDVRGGGRMELKLMGHNFSLHMRQAWIP